MSKALAVLPLAVLLAAQHAFAEGLAAQGYVGLSAGQSTTSFDARNVSGLGTVSASDNLRKTAYKFYVGYDFNRNWGAEIGYADLGRPGFSYTSGGLPGSAEAKESAWYLAAKGNWPVNQRFNLFGKLGGTRNRLEVNGADAAKTDWLLGVGAEYSVSKQVGVRLEYEDFGRFGDDNGVGQSRATAWTLGVTFKSMSF